MTSWAQWPADWSIGAHRGMPMVTITLVIRVTMVIACFNLAPISELVEGLRLIVVITVTTALIAIVLILTSLLDLVEQALEG